MKTENEVDAFFEPIFTTNQLMKSAKRKSIFRITGVSFFVSICVILLLILLKMQLTPYFMHKKIVAKELYYELYGANIYTGNWQESYQLVGSSATAPTYKLLNGKPVYLREVSLNSSMIEPTIGKSELEQFSYKGHRVMNFFHPSIQYETYANDLNRLDQVSEGKLIEMSLSFDEPYTYEQVITLLPKDVMLQWNWVNTLTADEIAGESSAQDRMIFKEHEVVGFSTLLKDGTPNEAPMQAFLSTLEEAKKSGGSYQEEFEQMYTTLQNGQKAITEQSIDIIGVVVVGTKQQLSTLKNQQYIQASSFGAIVDTF